MAQSSTLESRKGIPSARKDPTILGELSAIRKLSLTPGRATQDRCRRKQFTCV